MKKVEMLARELAGEVDMAGDRFIRSYGVKLDLTQAMHVDALSRKLGITKTEATRSFLDLGIEAMYEALNDATRAEMKELCLQVAKELISEEEKGA